MLPCKVFVLHGRVGVGGGGKGELTAKMCHWCELPTHGKSNTDSSCNRDFYSAIIYVSVTPIVNLRGRKGNWRLQMGKYLGGYPRGSKIPWDVKTRVRVVNKLFKIRGNRGSCNLKIEQTIKSDLCLGGRKEGRKAGYAPKQCLHLILLYFRYG